LILTRGERLALRRHSPISPIHLPWPLMRFHRPLSRPLCSPMLSWNRDAHVPPAWKAPSAPSAQAPLGVENAKIQDKAISSQVRAASVSYPVQIARRLSRPTAPEPPRSPSRPRRAGCCRARPW